MTMAILEPEIEVVARAICREQCAFYGEPACFDISNNEGGPMPWPNPNCTDPGCVALASVAVIAMRTRR
jgi:hypothetical protein